MDLLLNRNPGVHDLVFVNGECPTTGDMIDRVVQRLYIRLRTFFGEWFLNVQYGVPWLEEILGQRAPKSRVDMIIQNQILSEDEVKQITEFSSTMNNSVRDYRCSFRVKVASGQTSELITI
jgi:hypothetical protein